jgi:hypothetical protein
MVYIPEDGVTQRWVCNTIKDKNVDKVIGTSIRKIWCAGGQEQGSCVQQGQKRR